MHKWGEKSKVLWPNPVIECPAASTDRTIAYTDVIQIGVHFKSNASAMAGALIGLLHGLALHENLNITLRRFRPSRGLAHFGRGASIRGQQPAWARPVAQPSPHPPAWCNGMGRHESFPGKPAHGELPCIAAACSLPR
jgi:hypothetical protein